MPHQSSLSSEGPEHSSSSGVPISSLLRGQQHPDSTAALPGQIPLPIVLSGFPASRVLLPHVLLCSSSHLPFQPCLPFFSREKANPVHPSVWSVTGENELYVNAVQDPQETTPLP